MDEIKRDSYGSPLQRRASGSLSGSESDSEADPDHSRKRKRPMNVTYVYPRFLAACSSPSTPDSMADIISCEACKQRKVKCGRCCPFLFQTSPRETRSLGCLSEPGLLKEGWAIPSDSIALLLHKIFCLIHLQRAPLLLLAPRIY
jgi:hypothetical protein